MDKIRVSDLSDWSEFDSFGYAPSRIYLQDCIEGMKQYEDNHFDLAVVDPPYGIDVKTRVFNDGKSWDSEIPKQEYWTELFRISKNQIVWGGNYFIDYLYATKCFLVWDKKITEENLMSMAEMAWTSFDTKSLIFKQPPVGDRGFYNIDGTRIHPTQKSIKLYEWQLKHFANEGDKILDTHLGSGSSRIAANKAGLDFTGFEIDEEYFNQSEIRFKKFISQTRMF
jgi:site-specific DNA-methyltransferase (adenine-specific)